MKRFYLIGAVLLAGFMALAPMAFAQEAGSEPSASSEEQQPPSMQTDQGMPPEEAAPSEPTDSNAQSDEQADPSSMDQEPQSEDDSN